MVGILGSGVMVKCMEKEKKFDQMDRCGTMGNGPEDNPFDPPMNRGVEDHDKLNNNNNSLVEKYCFSMNPLLNE